MDIFIIRLSKILRSLIFVGNFLHIAFELIVLPISIVDLLDAFVPLLDDSLAFTVPFSGLPVAFVILNAILEDSLAIPVPLPIKELSIVRALHAGSLDTLSSDLVVFEVSSVRPEVRVDTRVHRIGSFPVLLVILEGANVFMAQLVDQSSLPVSLVVMPLSDIIYGLTNNHHVDPCLVGSIPLPLVEPVDIVGHPPPETKRLALKGLADVRTFELKMLDILEGHPLQFLSFSDVGVAILVHELEEVRVLVLPDLG